MRRFGGDRGLTEGALQGGDAVETTLHNAGVQGERLGASMRALQPYIELMDPNAVRRVHVSRTGSGASPSAWWRRLFG